MQFQKIKKANFTIDHFIRFLLYNNQSINSNQAIQVELFCICLFFLNAMPTKKALLLEYLVEMDRNLPLKNIIIIICNFTYLD